MNTFFQSLNPATTALPIWYIGLVAICVASFGPALFFVVRDFVRGLKNPA